jgi:hypothetical protein
MQLRDTACDELWFRNAFLSALQATRISVEKFAGRESGRLELGIEDPLLRTELEARIKKLKGYPDYSVNREILKIDFATFSALLEQVASDKKKDIEKAIITVLKSKDIEQPKLISWQDLMNEFLRATVQESGKQIADLSLGLLTGGATSIIQAVKRLLNVN